MSEPVNRLVIYRPKKGHEKQLRDILVQHGPMLRQVGLLSPEPIRLYDASDLRRHGEPEPYFIEIFQWRDEKASDLAHQTPEVMSVWETMGPHMESMQLTTLVPISVH